MPEEDTRMSAEVQEPIEIQETKDEMGAETDPAQALVQKIADSKAQTALDTTRLLSFFGEQETPVTLPTAELGGGIAVDSLLTGHILKHEERMGVEEFMFKSRAVEQNCQKKIEHIDRSIAVNQKKIAALKGEVPEIEQQMQAQTDKRGFARLFIAPKLRVLRREHEDALWKIEMLSEQMRQQTQARDDIHKDIARLKERQEEYLYDEVGKTVAGIRGRYEAVFADMMANNLFRDADEQYIDTVIVPIVKKAMQNPVVSKHFPDGEEKLRGLLLTFLEAKRTKNGRYLDLREQLQPFFGKEFWGELEEHCKPLIFFNKTEHMAKGVMAVEIAHEVAVMVRTLFAASARERDGWSKKSVDKAVAHGILAEQDTEDEETRRLRGWAISEYETTEGGERYHKQPMPELADMPLWAAVRSSGVMQHTFPESVSTLDHRYETEILSKSLFDSDGGWIDLLKYYPTPDGIRNLVLLAAAERVSYRAAHANWALQSLHQRLDWPEILDSAEAVYPKLKGARQVLEQWKHNTYETHPMIRDAAAEFTLDLLTNPPDKRGKKIFELASEAIPDNVLLTVTQARGRIQPDTAAAIAGAMKCLEGEKLTATDLSDLSRFNLTAFHKLVRQELIAALKTESEDSDKNTKPREDKLGRLSRAIIDAGDDVSALQYLTKQAVVDFYKAHDLSSEDAEIFFGAYKHCPALVTENDLLKEFCAFPETPVAAGFFQAKVEFFRDLVAVYIKAFPASFELDQVTELARLVRNGKLTKERAVELPDKAASIFNRSVWQVAVACPEFFFVPPDGPALLEHIKEKPIGTWEEAKDYRLGQLDSEFRQHDRSRTPASYVFSDAHGRVRDEYAKTEALTDDNWYEFFLIYAQMMAGIGEFQNGEIKEKLTALMADSKNRDFCLERLHNLWQNYLKKTNEEVVPLPYSLILVARYIEEWGGAGNLSQVESLCGVIAAVDKVTRRKTIAPQSRKAALRGMKNLEDRLDAECWDNSDRSELYRTLKDLFLASEAITVQMIELLNTLSPAQMRQFTREIYPLCRVALTLMEKKNDRGTTVHDRAGLIELRKIIVNFSREVKAGTKEPFAAGREKMHKDIKARCTDRFGIKKVPDEFSEEATRSLMNVSTYLANLHDRSEDKETMLGFDLALLLNGAWPGFRRGEAVAADTYLVPTKAAEIQLRLEERGKLNPLTAERLGIAETDLPEFMRLLQEETHTVTHGSIETIDIKLMNVILNLDGLKDPDLYPDAMDKARVKILLAHGNKKVGAVAAKMFREFSKSGGGVSLTQEELEIKKNMEDAMTAAGITPAPTLVKEHWQDKVKPLAAVVNALNFVEESNARVEIAQLRELLKPTPEIIAIFKRLGEDFTPTSGALALSQDLQYLDTLVVKREDELQSEEKRLLTEYIAHIRAQIVKLQQIHEQMKNKMSSLKRGGSERNALLRDKLVEIDKIMQADANSQSVITTMTNNLNTIIENMRECLACTKEGSNNDTNLTFADMNKFHLVSQGETQHKGSLADEIVFVEPLTRPDGAAEMAFVMDRLYGANTPTVLDGHVSAIRKKAKAIRERFTQCKLSIFVPQVVVNTGGLSPEIFIERLAAQKISATAEEVEIDVAASAFGDHYIEFGGEPRQAGKRKVAGVRIAV